MSPLPVPTTPRDRRALLWLLLAAAVVLGAGIGLRDPWPADEPRFALVARQMVESGDWLFPHRGMELYPDKPPMLMWLQGLSYHVVGDWRIAFLLPSLLSGLLTLVLVWDLGRRWWSPRAGWLAALAVLSALMFTFQFKRAQIDPLVTALLTLAHWGVLRHLVDGPNWRALWLGAFAAGLAVITKVVGVLVPLMLLPYLLMRRGGWPRVTPVIAARGDAFRWALAVLAFVAGAAIWLAPMLWMALSRGTPEYLGYVHNVLFHQTADRYVGVLRQHIRPFYEYVPIVLLHFLPLSLAYGAGARDAAAAWRARDARVWLPLAWAILVVLFFSAAAGKREVYILPILPMLAVALAPTLERIADARWLHGAALALAALLGLGLVSAGLWAASGQWRWLDTMATVRGLTDEAPALARWVTVAGAAWLVAAAVGRVRRGMHALLAGLAVFWLIWGLAIAPIANRAVSAAGVMAAADRLAGPQGEIGLVKWKEQDLLMAPRPVRDFGFRAPGAVQFDRAVAWMSQAPDRRWVFALGTAVAPCVERSAAKVIGHSDRREWWMFQSPAVRPGCRLPEVPGDDDDEP